jgi:uncharacterized membrane protein
MILEIVIVILVSIPSIIYAFRKIKKVKSCCCTCEQDSEPEKINENRNQSNETTQTLMQYLINKFTPRKNINLPNSSKNEIEISQNNTVLSV